MGTSAMAAKMGLKKKRSSIFKLPECDSRVYTNVFSNVIVLENGARVFKPMRYRLRPADSNVEVPLQFNVYNARKDSLQSKQTWKKLFMQKHGLFPFVGFYEWVIEGDKKG